MLACVIALMLAQPFSPAVETVARGTNSGIDERREVVARSAADAVSHRPAAEA
jgi:hypothetical protein